MPTIVGSFYAKSLTIPVSNYIMINNRTRINLNETFNKVTHNEDNTK